jgi:hypothetical protein
MSNGGGICQRNGAIHHVRRCWLLAQPVDRITPDRPRFGWGIDFCSQHERPWGIAMFPLYASDNAGIVVRMPGWPWLVRNHVTSLARVALACPFLLFWAASNSLGAESTPPPSAGSEIEPTNAHEAIAAFLQLQEQLRATQLAIERNFHETKAVVAQNAEAWSKGLQTVQETFAVQRARDMEAMQRSNQLHLMVAGALAAAGFFALLLVAYFQWCMSRGLAEIAAALPTALRLDLGTPLDALGPGEELPLPLLEAPEPQEQPRREVDAASPSAPRPRRGLGWSIGRRLFPNPGDALRRRQFRALGLAMLFGLFFAAVMALGLYLLYKGPRS